MMTIKSKFLNNGILRDNPFIIQKNIVGFLTILFGLILSDIYGKDVNHTKKS